MPRSKQLGTQKNTRSNHDVSDIQVGNSELLIEEEVPELVDNSNRFLPVGASFFLSSQLF